MTGLLSVQIPLRVYNLKNRPYTSSNSTKSYPTCSNDTSEFVPYSESTLNDISHETELFQPANSDNLGLENDLAMSSDEVDPDYLKDLFTD